MLHQIHSSKFYYINKAPKRKLVGDGLITKKNGLALSILTADCAPILIYDKKTKMIGAIHAGWKGAYKKIVIKMLKFFLKKKKQERKYYCRNWTMYSTKKLRDKK